MSIVVCTFYFKALLLWMLSSLLHNGLFSSKINSFDSIYTYVIISFSFFNTFFDSTILFGQGFGYFESNFSSSYKCWQLIVILHVIQQHTKLINKCTQMHGRSSRGFLPGHCHIPRKVYSKMYKSSFGRGGGGDLKNLNKAFNWFTKHHNYNDGFKWFFSQKVCITFLKGVKNRFSSDAISFFL